MASLAKAKVDFKVKHKEKIEDLKKLRDRSIILKDSPHYSAFV